MNTKQRLDASLKIKSVGEKGEFSGYGSIFGLKDAHDDIVVEGAFKKSLDQWSEKGRLPSMLWQHKQHEPIGVYTNIVEDKDGLYVEGKLLVDDDDLAKRAYAHLKAGSLGGLSIGYYLNDYDYDQNKDAFLLKEIDLFEVSLVTFPANDEARVSNLKGMITTGCVPKPKHIENILRDAGLSRSQAKKLMAEGYSAIGQRDAEAEQALSILKSIFD